MKRRLVLPVVAAAILATVAASFLLASKPAPEVSFTTLDGRRLATSELRGKVLLVNFWATYCASCIEEMPKLVETHRRYAPRGYETIAVAVSKDHPNRVAAFAAQRSLPFAIALDGDGTIARDFGNIRITPTTFLIDRRGRILKRYLGEPDWAEFHALIEKALAEPA